MSVADPRFPIGRQPHREALTPKVVMFQIILYVTNERIWTLQGGMCRACPLDLPMYVEFFTSDYLLIYDFLSAFKINITT